MEDRSSTPLLRPISQPPRPAPSYLGLLPNGCCLPHFHAPRKQSTTWFSTTATVLSPRLRAGVVVESRDGPNPNPTRGVVDWQNWQTLEWTDGTGHHDITPRRLWCERCRSRPSKGKSSHYLRTTAPQVSFMSLRCLPKFIIWAQQGIVFIRCVGACPLGLTEDRCTGA